MAATVYEKNKSQSTFNKEKYLYSEDVNKHHVIIGS